MAAPSDEAAQQARLGVQVVTAAERGSAGYEALLREVLEVQSPHRFRLETQAMAPQRGFLLRTWTTVELEGLLEEGGYLLAALDRESRQLQGYAMIAQIHHLPPGTFHPEPDAPFHSRAQLLAAPDLRYGYQIVVRRDRKLDRVPVGAALFSASQAEGERRRIDILSCVLQAPVHNARSDAFLAPRRKRIGRLVGPSTNPLLQGQLSWVCYLTWPLRSSAPVPDV